MDSIKQWFIEQWNWLVELVKENVDIVLGSLTVLLVILVIYYIIEEDTFYY